MASGLGSASSNKRGLDPHSVQFLMIREPCTVPKRHGPPSAIYGFHIFFLFGPREGMNHQRLAHQRETEVNTFILRLACNGRDTSAKSSYQSIFPSHRMVSVQAAQK